MRFEDCLENLPLDPLRLNPSRFVVPLLLRLLLPHPCRPGLHALLSEASMGVDGGISPRTQALVLQQLDIVR